MTSRSGVAPLTLGLAVAIAGCSAQKAAFDAGIPGIDVTLSVESVVARDFVLEATLEGDGIGLVTYVPNDEPCRRLLVVGQQVTWLANQPRGRMRVGDEECDAQGIGSLRLWRDRKGRTGSLTSDPVPRAQANFRVVHRDEDVVFLRGFFPLAAQLSWPGGADTIAVVPNEAICQRPIDRGVASMEFRPRGPNPLALVSSNGLCGVIGLIQPPSQNAPPRDAPDEAPGG